MNKQFLQVTQRVQFRFGNIGFWCNVRILPQQYPLTLLQQADAATMNNTTQKNRRQGQLIHQEALTNRKHCPVKSLTDRVHHILINSETNNNNIAVVYTNGTKGGIRPLHISKIIKSSVRTLGLKTQGIMEHMVDTHSL